MDVHGQSCSSATQSEKDMDLRRGPWTTEEDLILANYIANHGEGQWNSLARCAGLKRTGKSCRLRWLNYLRPDVRRGNITPEEQLLILELHSRWGNRWSKIAQLLPGRTDNEIKNYWRTRVQKHAKQLRCDVNSKQFKDTMRCLWIPRLVERIQAASSAAPDNKQTVGQPATQHYYLSGDTRVKPNFTLDNSSTGASSENSTSGNHVVSPVFDMTEYYVTTKSNDFQTGPPRFNESLTSPPSYFNDQGLVFPVTEQSGWLNGNISDNTWSMEDIWFLQQQLCNDI